MSDFLQFALKKGTEEHVTNDDVVRWAGGLDNWEFYNAAAVQIAMKYHQGHLTYSFCDWLMNELWRAVQASFTNGSNRVPEPFYEIYLAFGAGEYHRSEDKSDDPVAAFTDPLIADLVSRMGPK
jgi:hypothetical protein